MRNFSGGKRIITYSEMRNVLNNYGAPDYTLAGFSELAELLGGCLTNIINNSIEDDFDQFGDAFEPEEKAFFIACARQLKAI